MSAVAAAYDARSATHLAAARAGRTRAGRIAATRRGSPHDSVTLRVLEASGRGVQRITFRWTGDEHAIATWDGGHGIPFHLLRGGRVRTVIYEEPAGMQIVRADTTH